jgi:hypothetical protein
VQKTFRKPSDIFRRWQSLHFDVFGNGSYANVRAYLNRQNYSDTFNLCTTTTDEASFWGQSTVGQESQQKKVVRPQGADDFCSKIF